MHDLFRITVIGSIAGIIGTGSGGLIILFVDKITKRFLSFIMEFSAGLMMSVVCFDLLPEAFSLGGIGVTIVGMVIGTVLIVGLDDLIRRLEVVKRAIHKGSLLRAGILLAVGIALHNFPEGVAIGSGFDASMSLGLSLALVIALHDMPEGIAMAIPMRAGGMAKGRVIFWTILSGVPTGIGALLGGVLGGISNMVISICLGFAGGAMLYIICGELIPESKSMYRGRLSSIGNILGIITGMVLALGLG